MVLQLRNDDFGTLVKSGQYEDALQDSNFIKKAIKLFDLREKIWKTSERSETAIAEAGEEAAENRARVPGRIGFGVAGALAGFGALGFLGSLFAAPLLLGGLFVAGAVLAGGFTGRAICRAIAKSGPEDEAARLANELDGTREKMLSRIGSEIDTMDGSLVNQTPQLREEFRSAFRHASVKEEARLGKIHRAKVEHEAEEAAEAAQTAATMSTIAAMNSATAAMNSARR